MNYWAVGSSFGGTDDRTNEFIKNKNWFDGKYDSGDLTNENHLKEIKAGDILVMKSSATKGKNHKLTFTKLKAIGIVTEVEPNYNFIVNWLPRENNLPLDFDGISYRKIIEPLRDDSMKDYVNEALKSVVINDLSYLLEHKKQIILQGPPGTGKTYLAKELAKQLTGEPGELQESEYRKLIQFHPSYTYEDFVRGIVVETIDNTVSYKTINKVFGSYAKRALKNYVDSKKDKSTLSKEIKLDEYFQEFVSWVNDELEANETYISLTDNVGLIGVEEDAFRYKNNKQGWNKLGNRMLFKDIIQAYDDGNKERQDLKKNNNLSGLANQHASYFVRVLNMFQEYLKNNNLNFEEPVVEQVELKNYVLIIDEINRANLPSVLGELIYALEYRGEAVESMYAIEDNNQITIPPNLYIIGTMNTADRSVGHIDYAIRRRFAFVEVLPDESVIDNVKAKTLFNEVSKLFVDSSEDKPKNSKYLTADFDYKDIQLGHSYFLLKDGEEQKQIEELKLRLQYEIKPILLEYVKDGILQEDAKEFINDLQIV